METSTGNRMCFANAGSLPISFNDVMHFHSGNNVVKFSYIVAENGCYCEVTLQKWENRSLTWGWHAHVYNVLIY
ncbi:beta/gamma crystallin domain-containing protein [Allostreptomyces psammosilenae]|uniref:Streptomyces killer toxin-like beta/gamma crystallin domain-containing protein n=1 Tax=Allostreptomyces psammosilenae TaxID=1892865 RepID=A0A853A7N3_9ACTN|nr:beta/gamma crystallin domain-containing protein [Allostreptomyces psammosilenae]NYI06452.1 hypothetical protein [Allostreptomyces psammosilenae]